MSNKVRVTVAAAVAFLVAATAGVLLVTGGEQPHSSARAAAISSVAATDGTVVPNGELGFDVGGVPHGSNGAACNTGAADGPDAPEDQYGSVQELGNTSACTNQVSYTSEKVRTPDSTRSMKIVMGANQQREYDQSKFSFTPDKAGTVDQFYGVSIFYDSKDWKLSELSGTQWDDPFSWRTSGANGSLNFSSDTNSTGDNTKPSTTYSGPHIVLRRNTVLNQNGFYKDGLGIDKMDLGPVVLDKWMDFVCHVKWVVPTPKADGSWDPAGGNGSLRECWRDGVYMGKRTSYNAVDTNVHHIRVGQYQATNIPHARTSYFDNVRVGTSYAVVDPARAGATPTTAPPTTAPPTTPPPTTPPPTTAPPTTAPPTTAPPTTAPPTTAPPTTAPPAAGVSFVGSASGSSTTTSVAAKTPALAAGDVALVGLSTRGNPTFTPPAGWTLVVSSATGSTMHQAVYQHKAAAAEAARSWTFGLSSAQTATWASSAWAGATVGTHATASSASTSIAVPGVTGADRAVAFVGQANASTLSPSTSWTQREQVSTPTASFKSTLMAQDSASGAATTAKSTVSSAAIAQTVGLVAAP